MSKHRKEKKPKDKLHVFVEDLSRPEHTLSTSRCCSSWLPYRRSPVRQTSSQLHCMSFNSFPLKFLCVHCLGACDNSLGHSSYVHTRKFWGTVNRHGGDLDKQDIILLLPSISSLVGLLLGSLYMASQKAPGGPSSSDLNSDSQLNKSPIIWLELLPWFMFLSSPLSWNDSLWNHLIKITTCRQVLVSGFAFGGNLILRAYGKDGELTKETENRQRMG